MKSFLFVICLVTFTCGAFAQQFSLYNTGTLYESFENPSVKTFIPDSSRKVAFNFLIPNLYANGFLSGDAQVPLKTRIFKGYYNTAPLKIDEQRYNYGYANAGGYAIMLKLYSSLNGNQELGFFGKSVLESRTAITDESVALLNGPNKFPDSDYDNIFNNKYTYQIYHQFGFTYREDVDDQLSFGVKLGALLGVAYSDLKINQSHITFNNENNSADITLAGVFKSTGVPGNLTSHDFLPTFRNPGAGLSFGLTYKTESNIIIQGNLKDVGFIHWATNSSITDFDKTGTINDLAGRKREDSIYNTAYNIIHKSQKLFTSYTTPTNGKIEISASKTYFIDADGQFRYSPTLVGSKSLIYTDFTAAMVNRFNYNNLSLSINGSYNNMRYANLGLQFMVKSPNAEFFIGSESIVKSAGLLTAQLGSNSAINQPGSFMGADFYIGFSVKFGNVIEHPMDASSIPMGEKGFFGRLYNRLFKTND